MTKTSIFIIPNGLTHAGYNKLSGDMFRNNIKETFGYDVRDEEPLVQVWYTGEGSDNWSDHGCPKEMNEKRRVSGLVPVALLKNAKEGETIALTIFGRDIEFNVSQKEFRYRNQGDFQDVLESLLWRFEDREVA